jgi:hypothetical protein
LNVRFDRLHDFECEVDIGEAEDAPTGQGCLVVFLDVGDEPGTAVVAPTDPDAAFDFNECARGYVGEVGAPLARRVEVELAFEFGTLNGEPEELKPAFELGSIVAVAEALSGEFHPSRGESTDRSLFHGIIGSGRGS